MLIYEIGCLYKGGVFVSRMECLYTGWSVSIREGVLVYVTGVLVNGMGC